MRNKTGILIGLVAVTAFSSQIFAADSQPKKQHQKRPKPPIFSELDINQDGLVTLEEFKQHNIPHPDHETIFAHIDKNADGNISADELANHKPPKRRSGS